MLDPTPFLPTPHLSRRVDAPFLCAYITPDAPAHVFACHTPPTSLYHAPYCICLPCLMDVIWFAALPACPRHLLSFGFHLLLLRPARASIIARDAPRNMFVQFCCKCHLPHFEAEDRAALPAPQATTIAAQARCKGKQCTGRTRLLRHHVFHTLRPQIRTGCAHGPVPCSQREASTRELSPPEADAGVSGHAA